MKWLLWLFIAFLIAVGLGLAMYADPGYVLVVYKSWSMQTTLWVFLLVALLLFVLLYLLTSFWRSAHYIARKINYWKSQHSSHKSQQLTNKGLCAWVEGKWSLAEKYLLRGAKHSENSLLNYLAAARAAQAQGKYDKRDTFLRKAHKSSSDAEIAVGLTQAQLQLAAKQYEQTLATLRHLQQLVPQHTYVLQLLQRVYEQLKDWESLQKILPLLRKHKVFAAERLEQLEQQVYCELLKQADNKNDIFLLRQLWHEMSDSLHNNTDLLLIYSNALIKNNDTDAAEKILRVALKKNWCGELVEVYSRANSGNASKQLATATAWITEHDNDSMLLLCLGRLCKNQHLWGKAQAYLQTSVALKETPIAYAELAKVMEILGNKTAALDYYRKGLQLKAPL